MEFLFLIAGAVVVGFLVYSISKAYTETQQQNQEILSQKLQDLSANKAEKAALDAQIKAREKEVATLQEQYRNLQKYIADNEERAQKSYDTKVALLNKQYADKDLDLTERYKARREVLAQEIEEVSLILKRLKQTKSAAVEALQKEKYLDQEQIDSHRIDVSEQDLEDIKILQSIETRLSNPRILRMLIWQTYVQPIAKKKIPLIFGGKKVCGIYKIENLKNEKVYIGQAVDTYARAMQHLKAGLGIDCPQGNKLYAAMREDGIQNFTFELLAECEPEALNENEAYFIEVYNSVDYGYNGQSGNKKKV